MTQYDFIKKFCPDYEKKMKLFESEIVQSSNPVYHAAIEDSMFEDSLQNFANKICDKQKEICASNAKCKYNNDIFQSSTTSISSLVDSILNSPTPNLSDL